MPDKNKKAGEASKSSSYHERMKDDPEYRRKRSEYNARRYLEKRAEVIAKNRAWAKANPERVKRIDKAYRDRHQLARLFRGAKSRAKRLGREFDIELSDLVVPDVCPIFKVPFVFGATAGASQFSPSIDRIDSSKGYVKGNVRIISHLANCMKYTATYEQLVLFSEGVLSNAKEGERPDRGDHHSVDLHQAGAEGVGEAHPGDREGLDCRNDEGTAGSR